MKVLQTQWKQENENIINNALIIPKVTYFSREDVETIQPIDEGENKVVWKCRAQCSCLFEVYPDEEAFEKRVFPMAIFKKVIYLPYDEISKKDLTIYFLQALVNDAKDMGQDFTESQILDIMLTNYTQGNL